MNPLISVIIPVYNVEKYLNKCLESLYNQTYKHLEIICINDCSTDKSLTILEEYSNKDSRIKIINNQQNIGAGLSRNKGLEIAKGEYIHFLDSDDWLDNNAYEILIRYLNSQFDSKIIIFPLKRFDEIKQKYLSPELVNIDYCMVIDPNKKSDIINFWTFCTCNKFIKRSLVLENNIQFNNHRANEDVEFSLKLFLATTKAMPIPDLFYNYRINRPHSITSKRLNYINDLVEDAKYVNNLNNDYLKIYVYDNLFLYSFNWFYQNKISYEKLKDIIINNIERDFLGDSYYKKLYDELKNSNRNFEYKYKLRRFVKKILPALWSFYIKSKSLFQTR